MEQSETAEVRPFLSPIVMSKANAVFTDAARHRTARPMFIKELVATC